MIFELFADPMFRLIIALTIVTSCLYWAYWFGIDTRDNKRRFSKDTINRLFAFTALGTGANAAIVGTVYSVAPQLPTLLNAPTPFFYTIGDILGAIPFVAGSVIIWRNRNNLKFKELSRLLSTDIDAIIAERDEQKQIADDRKLLLHLVSHDLSVKNEIGELKYILSNSDDNTDPDTVEGLKTTLSLLKLTDTRLNGLSEFNRIKIHNLAPINTNQLVEHIVNVLELDIVEAGANVKFGELPWVVGSKEHLGHVFQNLIGNAIKYRHPDRKPQIAISGYQDDKNVNFSVSDNGLGVPYGEWGTIFEMFQSAHKNISSSGVGLTIVKKIIEMHDGIIWVESVEGEGSTFNFSLPLTAND